MVSLPRSGSISARRAVTNSSYWPQRRDNPASSRCATSLSVPTPCATSRNLPMMSAATSTAPRPLPRTSPMISRMPWPAVGDLVQVAAHARLGCGGQVDHAQLERAELLRQRAQQRPLGRLGDRGHVGDLLLVVVQVDWLGAVAEP